MEFGAKTDPHGEGRTPDRGVARRQAFLSAARDVFLEQGFAATSVNDVVSRAGGSLATLYSQFGNKEGLFLAVCEDQYSRFLRDVTAEGYAHLPLEEGLYILGHKFFTATMAPEHLAFFRIAVGGAHSHPQLLQRYLVTGLNKLRDPLLAYLQTGVASDGRKVPDPENASTFFFDLLRSRHHYRALASIEYTLTPEQIESQVREAVHIFLFGALPA